MSSVREYAEIKESDKKKWRDCSEISRQKLELPKMQKSKIKIPIRAKVTSVLLFLWGRLPWLFTKKFRYIGRNNKSKSWKDSAPHPEKSSLLDSTCKWKALAIITPLNANELKKAHSWMRKLGLQVNYDHERDRQFFESEYAQAESYRFITMIAVNRDRNPYNPIQIQSEHDSINLCGLSLQKIAKGTVFLSLYCFFSDKAKEKLANIDVSMIGQYCELTTLNPLSNDFGAIRYCDIFNNIEDHTHNESRNVFSDARLCAQEILGLIGIPKESDELSLIVDVYRESPEPYFIDSREIDTQNDNDKRHTCIARHAGFYNSKISNHPCENYVERHIDKLEIDGIYICSKEFTGDSFSDFRVTGLAIHDSHLFIGMLISCAKKLTGIEKQSNNSVLKNTSNQEKNYPILFQSRVELEELRDKLIAVKESINSICESRFHDFARRAVDYQITRLDSLKEAIEIRRVHANEKIQYKNLVFQKQNAILVIVLALIQVACAIIQINQGNKQEEGKLQSAAAISKPL